MNPDMLELTNMAADNVMIFELRCDSHKQVLETKCAASWTSCLQLTACLHKCFKVLPNISKYQALFILALDQLRAAKVC